MSAKLIEADLFRRRYFEREGPSDEELEADIKANKIRGSIVCGRIYIADDALYNKEPWQPEKRRINPILEDAGR